MPWGKHNPLDFRGKHFAQMFERVAIDDVLPIVVVKDPRGGRVPERAPSKRDPVRCYSCRAESSPPPFFRRLTWMKSMCRMQYAARFRHGQAQCCPHPVARTRTDVAFRKEFPERNYSSLPALWAEWNDAYFRWDKPRLMVRYEDLLWQSKSTTKAICECVGGELSPDFNPIALSAKGGAGHGYHETGKNAADAKYGNETLRYAHLVDADVDFVNEHAGPAALDRFHYGLSRERRAAALGRAPKCNPSRVAWLESVGLKPGGHGGPVPLDDESDGVLVNGMFYPNPSKRYSGSKGSRIKHAIAKANAAVGRPK